MALPNPIPLLKFDPPVPVGEARRPRELKLGRKPPVTPGVGVGARIADAKAVPSLEDILSAVLPPKRVSAAEKLQPNFRPQPPRAQNSVGSKSDFVQFVSTQPATRLDVMHLQEQLDQRLTQRQAKDDGICAVRREIYADCFDELIRQITINCPERGLLLLRIRDDLRATMEAYRLVYESSVAFGVRKAMVAENGFAEMRSVIKQLEKEKAELEVKLLELQSRAESIERQAQEQRVQDEKSHNEEINFFRKTNHQLGGQLKTETDKANSKQK